MKVYNLYFTKTELKQLLNYLVDRDNGNSAGWYYGNKLQFEKRHFEIQTRIERILDEIEETKPITK